MGQGVTTACTDRKYTPCSIQKGTTYFDYNSRISQSVFIILAPVERGMNTPQYHVIYLLNCLITP